ncbi:MAG TPA: diguanylate cyclase [Burkholderiaceae bacterium]
MTIQVERRPTILVVEDEWVVAKDLQRSLSYFGYNVPSTAATADEAIRLAQDHRPDLVLMDVNLAGPRDGIEAARELRASHDVPVVFLTAFSDEDTVARAKVVEPHSYLVKPVKIDELRSAVELAIHKHALERRLREREQLLAATLRAFREAVIATDAGGAITLMNPAAERLTAAAAKESVGLPIQTVVQLYDERGGQALHPLHNPPSERMVLAPLRPGAERVAVETVVSEIGGDASAAAGWVVVLHDVSLRRRADDEIHRLNAELERLTLTDELTGLYNRRGLMLLGEQQLKLSARNAMPSTVLYVDVDGLKHINDAYGHEAGDRLLCDAAALLRRSFRSADLISRPGGDEFVVVASTGDAAAMITHLRRQIGAREPAADVLPLSLACGAAVFGPDDTRSLTELVAEADRAMYAEKRARRP